MSRLVWEGTEGKLSHGIPQKAAEYRMGGNLGSKETKQTTKPTRITSQIISSNCHTFVGQEWKHCYRKAVEAYRKLKAAALSLHRGLAKKLK